MSTTLAWFLIPVSAAILVLADMVGSIGGDAVPAIIAQGSALAALIWALYYLLSVYIPKKDKRIDDLAKTFSGALDSMAKRHDKWEQLRHEDSQVLRETMAAMRENCASVQASLVKRGQGDG